MAAGIPNFFKKTKFKQENLKFRNDGTFRILHISDIHEVDPAMDDEPDVNIPIKKSSDTINVIEKCIEKADPDLVVFGGDNISGYWEEFTYEYFIKTIKKITEPIVKRNIPLAIVFGNHDSEQEAALPFLRRENHINVYSEYSNFRTSYNDEDVYGCGNCSLPIYSHDGSKVDWNIWLIDSNDYVRDEITDKPMSYDSVHKDQIEWYERTSEKLKTNNGGKIVPSILFQHICVKELLDIVEECTEDNYDFKLGDKCFCAKNGAIIDGLIREMPCPGPDKEQFSSWKKTGNIVAAFFGHDHVNTFTVDMDGIKLIQTVGAGYHSYGQERGGRLIVLKENTKEFNTETIIIPQE